MNSLTDKDFLLKKSQSFCMAPWIHLYVAPDGVASPCCISTSAHTVTGVGNTRDQSLMELVNSEKMNALRVDMLSNTMNELCSACHNHEAQGITSARNYFNIDNTEGFPSVANDTNEDGSLREFKMRYFDIRFSNICNMKCRSCSSIFSSQWELEDNKNILLAKIVQKNNNKDFLQEVLSQIENMDLAYFAGGEPLITEEHYLMLEEMIRQGRTDIKLRYNTNLSNFKFKNKDLLSLWKQFKNPISINASIDHFGERAEYIRHGTDWATVENNFITAKRTPFIRLQMNTVVSIFNYVTLREFYQYIIDKQLFVPSDWQYSLYNMSVPEHLSAHVLPTEYKILGNARMLEVKQLLKDKRFNPATFTQIDNSIRWVESNNTWETYKEMFRSETSRLDTIRGESFVKTFPELAGLL